jgi:serine/threonine protein kinase
MVHKNEKQFAMFPGNSCFPLSPLVANGDTISYTQSGFPCNMSDQMGLILSTIGTPSKNDLGFISDPKAYEYVRSFPHLEKVPLKDLFPFVDDQCLDLLEKLLQFNPEKRLGIHEAIGHSVFDEVRIKTSEQLNYESIDSEIL